MSSVEIVLTGTELLLGEIVDTNSVMVAKMLHEIGLDILYKTIVGDNENRITEVLKNALDRVDFVIVSGGLGPTVDDKTRQAAAAATARELIYSHELEEEIAARFRGFGRQMSENNKRQAWIPEGAIPVKNPVGTAPCFIIEEARGTIICLPGVPRELEYQMENAIMPYLRERLGETQVLARRILRTCAIGESSIDDAIDDLMRLTNPTVGLAAHMGQVDIRLVAKADTAEAGQAMIAPIETEVRKRLGDHIFGMDDETLPGVVGRLLKERGLKLTVLDSVTDRVIGQQLFEAGYGEQLAAETVTDSLQAALDHLSVSVDALTTEPIQALSGGAANLSQPDKVALCIVGPVSQAEGDPVTYITLAHQEQTEVRSLRQGFASRSRRPWLIAQTFDLLWRYLRN